MIPLLKGANGPLGRAMQRVDGYYLYQVGAQIHPLAEFTAQVLPHAPATILEQARFPIYIAESALEALITRSIFKLRTSVQPGQNLLLAIRALKAKIEDSNTDTSKPLDWFDAYSITSALTAFEAVLGAELSLLPLYVVAQKAGYDTASLIENGAVCFPAEIWIKAPDAVADLQQGTKCIAYEVFTASGFHFHRANEAVLRHYWDAVSKGKPRPASRNMGEYLRELDNNNFGDAKVRSALRDLKDLHRNPLIHPEHAISSAQEAMALMNGVHNVMVYMLQEIPVTAPTPAIPTGSVAAAALSAPTTSSFVPTS
jgi:hypothetical protein